MVHCMRAMNCNRNLYEVENGRRRGAAASRSREAESARKATSPSCLARSPSRRVETCEEQEQESRDFSEREARSNERSAGDLGGIVMLLPGRHHSLGARLIVSKG
jgi:hypothetical protein